MNTNESPSLHDNTVAHAAGGINSGTPRARLVFEVTGAGFDGGTDATDDRVLWLVASDEHQVLEAIADCGATYRGEIHEDCRADVDFELPQQVLELQVKLLRWASRKEITQPPATVQVVMERNDDGNISGKVFATRVGAEQHLRTILAEYESGGEAVFTENEIEAEILRIRQNPEQSEEIVAGELGVLWIDVSPVNP